MTEIRPEDVALATAILEHYCGPVADLGQDKFLCFTNMTTDSFFWVRYGIVWYGRVWYGMVWQHADM